MSKTAPAPPPELIPGCHPRLRLSSIEYINDEAYPRFLSPSLRRGKEQQPEDSQEVRNNPTDSLGDVDSVLRVRIYFFKSRGLVAHRVTTFDVSHQDR